jgi:hypothetical protein
MSYDHILLRSNAASWLANAFGRIVVRGSSFALVAIVWLPRHLPLQSAGKR